MPKYSFPQSVRKYIRLQKADIRRRVLDMAEQKARISKLYEDMVRRYQTKKSSDTPIPTTVKNAVPAEAK